MNVIGERLTATRPRVIYAVVPALALVVGLVFLGRWEEHHNAAVQNARMAAVYRLATSDGLISKRLYAYRLDWRFDCLVYSPPGRPSETNALELCFDPQGRLVETIDRRTPSPTFGSLREQPSLATVRVPVRRLLAALAALHAFQYDSRLAGVSRDRSTLPVRFDDLGAFHFGPPIK